MTTIMETAMKMASYWAARSKAFVGSRDRDPSTNVKKRQEVLCFEGACSVFPRPISSPSKTRPPRCRPNSTDSFELSLGRFPESLRPLGPMRVGTGVRRSPESAKSRSSKLRISCVHRFGLRQRLQKPGHLLRYDELRISIGSACAEPGLGTSFAG